MSGKSFRAAVMAIAVAALSGCGAPGEQVDEHPDTNSGYLPLLFSQLRSITRRSADQADLLRREVFRAVQGPPRLPRTRTS